MVENIENKQASAIVHYCKICNRGFSCGGALGGHMRAHNIAEVINRIQEEQEEQESDFRCKSGGNKHSYFLRTTSNRFFNLQSSIRGENSGKRACFDDEKLVSPMSSSVSDIEDGGTRKGYIWKFLGGKGNESYSCGSFFSREEEDLANVLVTLSNNLIDNNFMGNKSTKEVPKGLFQCKACKKVFNSHQALGGHRASHKKVKGCYAAKLDDLTDDEMQLEEDSISNDEFSMPQDSLDDSMIILNNPTSQKSSDHDLDQASKLASKVHECSICHRVFSSGQALGGHKRCHWLQTDSTFMTPFHDQFQYYGAENNYRKSTISYKYSELLDLNLPPHQSNNIVDDKSTTTYLSPRMNVEPDDKNQGNYHNCKNIQNCGKKSSKTLHGYDHKYNGEEGRISKLAKHSNVNDLEVDRGSSPWLRVGITSTTSNCLK